MNDTGKSFGRAMGHALDPVDPNPPDDADYPAGWDPSSIAGRDVELVPGQRVRQYELIRELGRGGMGVVFAARDVKLGRRVAIKFLRDATREVAERFLVEARATAQCSHENIVIIHEVEAYEGMPYMVLEYLEGQTLREVMGEFGDGNVLAPSRVVELLLPIVRALARAHELGIVHRDLKPENVIVTTAGQIKVLDFGIAKALGDGEQRTTRPSYADLGASASLNLTGAGNMVGTLPYMAPEQMTQVGVDGRTDLWAVGVIAWEMLTGRHPVVPLTAEALYGNLVDPAPQDPIRAFVGNLPPQLAEVVDACLRKPIHERAESAALVVQVLSELLPGRHGRQLGDGESPYPGLTAFQEGDANRFFGRSSEVARVVARVRELPLIAIVGPSGVGKSSFVRAGVGPALKASGEAWEVITLRPGRHPLAALASVAHRLTSTGPHQSGILVGEHDQIVHRLRSEPGFLGTLLRTRARLGGSNILLFVDQFEELYTLVPEAAERALFTAALASIADDSAGPLRVIVSMRSDFLDRVGEHRAFLDELARGLVFLSPPDREGLREALEQPLEMVGYRFETAAMVGDMLDALGTTPGALPLLQFAAAKLWDARDRQQHLLTVASYHAIGGVSGALATHADEVVSRMSPIAARLAQQLFRKLVTPDRTRAIVELEELYQAAPDRAEIGRVIDQLVGARLLTVQTRGDAGGSVELVHESLIDRWPTLRRWLDEDQEDAAYLAQLAAAARQWDQKGRSQGLLWRGTAIDEARRWYAARTRRLAPRDEAFIEAGLALARRGKRIQRIGLTISFTLLTGVAIVTTVLYMQVVSARNQARANLVAAQQATIDAKQHETEAKQALEQRDAADRRKIAADHEAAAAQAKATAAQLQTQQTADALGMTQDQLATAYADLQTSYTAAQVARSNAEQSSKRAIAAQAAAEAATKQLAKALAEKAARVKALEAEAKKLSTTLK